MKYIVDIKGEIEGDYEIIGKYEGRPQGEWIRKCNENRVDICCTNCGYDDGYSCFNFCPNCGADMRGKKNEHL